MNRHWLASWVGCQIISISVAVGATLAVRLSSMAFGLGEVPFFEGFIAATVYNGTIRWLGGEG